MNLHHSGTNCHQMDARDNVENEKEKEASKKRKTSHQINQVRIGLDGLLRLVVHK
jgi:hypothetical protein